MKESYPRYSYEIVFDSEVYPFTCGGYFDIDQVLGRMREIMEKSNKKIKEANVVYMDGEGNDIKTPFEEAVRIRSSVEKVINYRF